MNEMRNGTDYGNLSQSVSEIAKHSSFSFTLTGWPAAATLISIPASFVLVYGIKAFAAHA